jgi:hypothetical protein
MKKLNVILALFIGIVCFGQTPPKKKPQKDIDKEANRVIDSLSKVYKVDIVSYMVESNNGITKTYITHAKDGKLVYILISAKKNEN